MIVPTLRRCLATMLLVTVAVVAGDAVRAVSPAHAAPTFNMIQFSDYCWATSKPAWCTGPGIYQVSYPVTGASVPRLLVANAGLTSQWAANGSKMVFEDGDFSGIPISVDGIGFLNADGTPGGGIWDPNASYPSISPDGTEVVYVENGSQLWEMSTSGGTPHEIGQPGVICGNTPWWAPAPGHPETNGLIVFTQCHGSGNDNDFLATVDPTQGSAATATPVAVIDNGPNAGNDRIGTFPSATPDGNTYYFTAIINGAQGIFSVPATGGLPTAGPNQPDAVGVFGAQLGTNGHLLYYDEYASDPGGPPETGKTFVDGPSGELMFSGANADPNDAQSYPTWAPGATAPAVAGVSPSQGAVAGGEILTITGSGFTGATEVDFLAPDGSTAAAVTPAAVSSDSITINQAPNLTAALNKVGTNTDVTLDVVVKTGGGASAVNANDRYTARVPLVTAVHTTLADASQGPAAGPLQGGETVTLTGEWLTGVTLASFQPVQDIPFVSASTTVDAAGTSLTFTAPNATAEYDAYRTGGGTGDLFVDLIVSVPVSGSSTAVVTSSSAATGADDTFYLVPVAVTDLSSHTSPVLGHESVTVTGTGLTNGTVVLAPPAGSSAGSGCNAGTPTSIPAQAGGTATSLAFITQDMSAAMAKTQQDVVCDVEVQVPVPEIAGARVTSVPNPGDPGDTLTFPFPKVTGLSAHQSLVDGGILLSIDGSGFTGVSRVEFVFTGFAVPPLTAAPASVIDNLITVQVPSAVLDEALLPNPLPTADVRIQIPDSAGGSITSEANQNDQFTYIIPTPPPCNTLNDCSSGTSSSANGSATATSTTPAGAITATGKGAGGITVGRYASNPVGAPSFTTGGTFFDVRVSTPNAFTAVTINDCDLGGATAIRWWNPAANAGAGAWQPVSNQVLTSGPPACILVTVNNATSPTLAQMLGTVFVGAAPTTQTAPLVVQHGWNLLSLPLQPTGTLMASALLSALLHNNAASHVAALFTLSGAGWAPPVIEQAGQPPSVRNDFPLAVGVGYLLYSDQSNSYSEQGTLPAGPLNWSVNKGWNLVGPTVASPSLQADAVLRGVLASGSGGQVAAIFELSGGGSWQPFRIDQHNVFSGSPSSFPLLVGAGYLLYTDHGATVLPGAAPRTSGQVRPGAMRPPVAGGGPLPPLPPLPR